ERAHIEPLAREPALARQRERVEGRRPGGCGRFEDDPFERGLFRVWIRRHQAWVDDDSHLLGSLTSLDISDTCLDVESITLCLRRSSQPRPTPSRQRPT